MYFALQEQVRAKLINLLTGRATNRKKRHHRDPPGPLPPGERTLPLGTQCGLHSQRGEGATEPPVTDGTLGGVHRAPPEPQSLTPAQAVWPSIWPSSGDTAALSTRPELAAFSSLRGKTRAGCESTTARLEYSRPGRTRGRTSVGLTSLLRPIDRQHARDRRRWGRGEGRCRRLFGWTRPSAQRGQLLRADWRGLRVTLLFYPRALERCRPHTHLYKHGCQSNALRTHTSLSFISWKNMLIFNQTRTWGGEKSMTVKRL